MRSRLRLHTKMVLLVALVAAGVGLASSLLVSRLARDALEKQLEERATLAIRTLAEHVTHSVIEGEIVSVREALQEIVERTKDVDYAYVMGFENEVFAHSFERGFPRALVHEAHQTARRDAPVLVRYWIGGVPILDVGCPLFEGMQAHVHIGMNESHAYAQIKSIRNRIMGLTLGVALLGALLGIAVSRRITRPLGRLAESMRAFGERGAEEELTPAGGGPEVAQLTLSFNGMIAERKRAREALRQSDARLRQAVETMPVMMDAFDEAGNIIVWNRECERVTGYSAEEIVGNPRAMELLYPDAEYRERMLKEWRERGSNYRGWEWIVVCKDGTRRTIAWSNISEQMPIPGWASWGVGVDVTERERLEERLRQASKMEAIGRLAGGVAHDFNNLLTAITGYSELLLARLGEDAPMRKDLEEIKTAGERAASLTRQLLAFSRKQVLQPTVLDLNAVVADMDKMLQRIIGEDVRLDTVPAPGLWRVKADRGQVEQVVLNLAVNARDAMPNGGTLTIETANVELDEEYARSRPYVTPGSYVMLAVSDTGTGMDDETASHVFEPFFTTKGPDKGTGLGLSTAYGIVKQSGGHIAVYSELGRGTTLKVYLPRVEEAAEPAQPRRTPAAPRRGSETVLLVEDDEAVRTLARRALEDNGYHVLEAPGPDEAIRACQQHDGPVHLILADVVMPKMSGPDLAARLTAQRQEMKVLYMSGYTNNAIAHHGVLDAGIAFIQKPFGPDDLARKVREVLDEPTPEAQ